MKKPGFWKHVTTDYDNETFDTGRALVVVIIVSMIFLTGWDVIVHAAKFDAQSFGTGTAALLVGLGAYLFGDNSKRPLDSDEIQRHVTIAFKQHGQVSPKTEGELAPNQNDNG